MAIPKLKKQDVIDALKFIDENGVPEHNTSVKYVLVSEDGKKYPPKYVVAVADHLANSTDISTESFNSVDAKNYLKSLGFNAVELMPVQEFDGNDSWGYNPCFYFALDKAYGTDRMYKAFIDKCHDSVSACLADIRIRNGHCILFFPVLRQCQALFKCAAVGVVGTGKHQPHLPGKIRPAVFCLHLYDTVFFLFQQSHGC